MLTTLIALALAACATREPPPAGVRVVPISGPLGLADLIIDPPRMPISGGAVLVWREDASEPVRVPLTVIKGPGAWRHHARVMAGSPETPGTGALRFSIEWTRLNTRPEEPAVSLQGPFEAEAAPQFPTPDWSKGIVWYQVFPDRFRNGNPDNDHRDPSVFVPAWNAPWYSLSPQEAAFHTDRLQKAGSGRAFDPSRPASPEVLRLRRYGGDLQGVVEQLDHLRDLGITGVYFCPIFQSSSLHRYDAADFRHIDANLGAAEVPEGKYQHDPSETLDPATWRWTQADRYFIDTVLPRARASGMRVIIDGVWNHVGKDHFAFADTLERGQDSEYASWFDLEFNDLGRVTHWGAWDRRDGNLPEFRREPGDQNIVAPARAHVADVTRRWMDPNADGDPSDGVDGWRLDVAGEVPPVFWREWHTLVRAINPQALSVAEIWDPANDRLQGDQFDAQMNYPVAFAMTAWLGLRPERTAAETVERLERVLALRPEVVLSQMNLLTSHDTEHLASMLANPGREYDRDGNAHRPGSTYFTGRPSEAVYRKVVLGIAFLATFPGSPMIYAGDEWGMTGADDPDNRRPLSWPDHGPYADDEGPHDLRGEFAAWLRLRQDPGIGPVLRFGACRFHNTGNPDVIAYERQLNDRRVLVVLNRSEREVYDAGALALAGESLDPVDARVAPLSARWFAVRTGE